MRVGFLSDAHGNVEAFELGLGVLRRFAVDAIYFLGDAVGYLPGPSVVEAVLAEGIPSIRGNHEAMLLATGSTIPHDDVYQLRSTATAMAPALLESVARWPVFAPPARERPGSAGPREPRRPDVWLCVSRQRSRSCRVAARTQRCDRIHGEHSSALRASLRIHHVRQRWKLGPPCDVGTLGACCVFDERTETARILRYDIRDAVARACRRCGPFHEMVDEVLARRAPSYVGEVVDV